MRILRYILATLAVLATFTACREEDELNKAKGRVVLGEIRIEAEEANTRAIAIPTPQPEDLTIEIIDPDGYTIESGKIDHYANGIDLFVASYTLRAYYGNKQQMGNSPYFEGIAEFSISEGQTTQIGTVTAKLANAVIIPNIPTNIIDHFIGVPTFYVCKGEEKKEVTNGQALYVLPGEYTLTLEGKNKAEIEVKQTIATLNAQAQKAYNINCDLSLPNLTLPDQQAGAWAKRLYITPATATDKNGKEIDTPKGIVYEAITLNGSWDNSLKSEFDDNNNIIIKGLTEQTSYQIRARLADATFSNIVNITTEACSPIPNGNMEEWSEEERGYYYKADLSNNGALKLHTFYPWDNNAFWNTNNDFTTRHRDANTAPISTVYYYNSFPAVSYTPDCHGGSKAAELRNTAAGRGNTSSSKSSYAFNNVPGELFIGNITVTTNGPATSPNDYYIIEQGKAFDARPSKLRFWHKYIPYDQDKWKVLISIYDENKEVITSKEYTSDKEVKDRYEEITISLDYGTNFFMPCKYIYINYSSSIYSGNDLPYTSKDVKTYFKDSERTIATLSGSQLFIDDIELIYE